MDVLPDFTTISDDDLKALIERYVHEEEEVSYRRRLLHGKIDILRAELVDRVKRRHAGDQSSLKPSAPSRRQWLARPARRSARLPATCPQSKKCTRCRNW